MEPQAERLRDDAERATLVARFYYVYAIDYDRGGEWGGKTFMCTRDKEFTIRGIEDCLARGFDRTGFFEIDTGEQKSWTVQLTDPSRPDRAPRDAAPQTACQTRKPALHFLTSFSPTCLSPKGRPMRRLRRIKILATLGPASSDQAMIARLFEAGADVFRINMSHTDATTDARAASPRSAPSRSEFGRPIGILADLQGPKLRVGKFKDGGVMLETGQTFMLDDDQAPGDADARLSAASGNPARARAGPYRC